MSDTSDHLTLDLSTCPCGGGTLDKLIQPALLAVLAEETAHGYRLAERLGELPICGGRKPDLSGIYRALKSMEANGLVVSSWDLSDTGPAKRLFRITPTGRQCLTHWIDTLQQYRKHINGLLKTVRKAAGQDRRISDVKL